METRKPLGYWSSQWSYRQAINEDRSDLEDTELTVEKLQGRVKRLTEDMLLLRATLMAVVDVLHAKAPFDEAELAEATATALAALRAGHAAATAVCDKCKQTVAMASATVTLDGVFCTSCAG
jgi:hypothetical protein